MGYRLVKFDVIPKENEQLEITVKLPEEPRSVIHGVVKDCKDRPIKDAVVKLFELIDPHNPCDLKPLTHTFTDECGQFIFGPLWPKKKYIIKVWHDHVKIRPFVIKPDPCSEPCDCEDACREPEPKKASCEDDE